jgi:hypothetical protein
MVRKRKGSDNKQSSPLSDGHSVEPRGKDDEKQEAESSENKETSDDK